MTEDPASFVSVIVPVRDGDRYLAATLRSVLNQTHRALEVIVVDDGSTDSTPAIAAELAQSDSRLRYVEATGSGVAAARNQGIGLARGDLVAPLDADDLWLPAKLERQVNRLAESDASVALAYSWTCLIDADDRVIAVSRPFDETTMRRLEGWVLPHTVYKSFIANGSNPVIRRHCIEEVGGYDTALLRREDWDLSLRLAERWPFALEPAFLVAYRQLPTSRSHGEHELLRSHSLITERVRREHGYLPPALLRWSRSECYTYAASRSASTNRPLTAARLFATAIALDPGQLLRSAPWQALAQGLPARFGAKSTPSALDLHDPATDLQFPMRPRSWPRSIRTPFEWLEQRRYERLQSIVESR